MLTKEQIQHIGSLSPDASLASLCEAFPGRVCFSTSLGQEDQVILDIIARHRLPVRIFTIDTGRLFNEHYELLEKNAARYRLPIEIYFPEATEVEGYARAHGVNGFYESLENRKSCCHIRKVKPLNRALEGMAVWVTGLRAGQSQNRHEMPLVEWLADKKIYKYNPLLHWSYDEMMRYIDQHRVPYSKLHDKGFISIGCAPCTRAVSEGEDSRAGRWWWETSKKECGLHEVNRNL